VPEAIAMSAASLDGLSVRAIVPLWECKMPTTRTLDREEGWFKGNMIRVKNLFLKMTEVSGYSFFREI
jgi:hypothetical protein